MCGGSPVCRTQDLFFHVLPINLFLMCLLAVSLPHTYMHMHTHIHTQHTHTHTHTTHTHTHTHTHTTHTHTHTHTYTHTHTHVALWLGSQRQLLSAPTSLLPISSLILPGPSRALGIHTLGRPHLLSCGADPGGRESLLPPLSSLPAAAATTWGVWAL